MGLFDVFKRKRVGKTVQVAEEKAKPQRAEHAQRQKMVQIESERTEKPYATGSRVEAKLDKMDTKLDELLEIKQLYNDMLDWLVELAKKSNQSNYRTDSSISRDTSTNRALDSTIPPSLPVFEGGFANAGMPILSPRLQQVLDAVKEKGEVLAEDVSTSVGLSLNRCSEILNALYRANYIEKHRAGRKVFYRIPAIGAPKAQL